MDSELEATESDGDAADAETIEIEVRQLRRGPAIDVEDGVVPSVAKSAGEVATSLMLYTARGSFIMGRAVWRRLIGTQIGQLISEAGAGAADAIAEELGGDLRVAARMAEERLGQVIAVVVPVAVEAVRPAELMRYIDVDAVIDQVDTNAILGRIDVNALLARIDIAGLLARIDINNLLEQIDTNGLIRDIELDPILERVDFDELLGRIDVAALLDQIDVNDLMSRVDVDAVLETIDIAALARSANIGELVAESTSDVAGSALDLGRRQAVALDTLLARAVNRLLRRDFDDVPQGPRGLVADGHGES